MYRVEDLYSQNQKKWQLALSCGNKGLKKKIKVPEIDRPGLSLSGYTKYRDAKRISLLGREEIAFLKDLDPQARKKSVENTFTFETPALFIAKGLKPTSELLATCDEKDIPLFLTPLATMNLWHKMTLQLLDVFAEKTTLHGTLVEVFGVGVLLQGDASVGKSEAALGLIERGHRLISDDIVRAKKKEDDRIEGEGFPLNAHHMEVRGIGIINVANIYGLTSIAESKSIDLVVKLETWDNTHFYDRVGLEEKFIEILGVQIPFHLLPVNAGRDVVLLLETLASHHRLKNRGYHAAKEFKKMFAKELKEKELCKKS